MGGQIVCAGLVKKDGDFLMVQESKEGISGLWSLPAGRVKPGENLQDCVRREVLEESNVNAEPVGIVGVYFNFDEEDLMSIIVYDMDYVDGEPDANHTDVQDAGWVPVNEIETRELRSYYISQALNDYHNRDRIPCAYVEHIEDLDPGKLAKLKMKIKTQQSDSIIMRNVWKITLVIGTIGTAKVFHELYKKYR